MKVTNKANILIAVGLLTAFLELTVIIGWVFDIQALKSILPDYVSMKMNTALSLILISIVFICLVRKKGQKICLIISVFLIAFGLVSFSQEIFGYNAGIDELFIKDLGADMIKNSSPGRPSSVKAICIALFGFGFLGIAANKSFLNQLGQYAFHTITLITFIAIMGYAFYVPAFYELSFMASVPIHSSISFFILSIAASFVRESIGLTWLFMGNGIGNMMARNLFPKIFLAMLLLSAARLILHKYNLLNPEFGIVLFAISFILVALYMFLESAKKLNAIDEKRKQAELQLILNNQELDRKVIERTKELSVANQALEVSREHFQRVFNLSNIGIVINSYADTDIKFVDANPAYCNMLGYEKEYIIGKNSDEIDMMSIDNRAKIVDKLMADGYLRNEETTIYGKNKKTINVLYSVDFYKVGSDTFILSTIVDITEQKQQEEKLKLYSQSLNKQNKQLKDFAYIISHNLRGYVSNLVALLEFYHEETTIEDKNAMIEKLETTVNNLGTTLNDLLEVVRIRSDFVVQRETLFFETIFLKLKQVFAGQIIASKTNLTADFSDAPSIEYIAVYLESIMQNLLSNALKYSEPTRPPIIHLTTKNIDGKIHFSITDNGLGIDLARHGNKLFGLNKTFHRHPEAKGVGLFITKAQIEAIGGEIKVTSQVDEGTTFTVIF